MNDYERLLSFGDFIKLTYKCDSNKLLQEVSHFNWLKYNPRKSIVRYGLSITSLNGELDGIDLDSLYQYNAENNTSYSESSFKTLTQVYKQSKEIQKVVDPFLPNNVVRSHIIHLPPGGHFPAHRDLSHWEENQHSFRIVIPLQNCNPEQCYFMYEDKPLRFDYGHSYFLNTNKVHSVFSMNDCYLIVLNILCNRKSVNDVINGFAYR